MNQSKRRDSLVPVTEPSDKEPSATSSKARVLSRECKEMKTDSTHRNLREAAAAALGGGDKTRDETAARADGISAPSKAALVRNYTFPSPRSTEVLSEILLQPLLCTRCPIPPTGSPPSNSLRPRRNCRCAALAIAPVSHGPASSTGSSVTMLCSKSTSATFDFDDAAKKPSVGSEPVALEYYPAPSSLHDRGHSSEIWSDSVTLSTTEKTPTPEIATAKATLTRILSKSLKQLDLKRHSRNERPADETSGSGKFRTQDICILKEIGSGAFAKVFVVKHAETNAVFALKCMKKDKIVKRKQVANILSEKRLLASMHTSSPFFLELHATFSDPTHLYLLMEYCPGGDLWQLLDKFQRLPEAMTRFYSGQIAVAINHLHARGIIYRDLKLENILLDARGNVKVADLGFAKAVPDFASSICGTADYMAPEIIQGKEYDCSVDWFAFGVLTHELLSGNGPFSAPRHDELLTYKNIVENRPTFSVHVSTVAEALIRRLIAQKPAARFGFSEVTAHKFFAGIDWDLLAAQKIQPPYTPTVVEHGGIGLLDAKSRLLSDLVAAEKGRPDPFEHFFAGF